MYCESEVDKFIKISDASQNFKGPSLKWVANLATQLSDLFSS